MYINARSEKGIFSINKYLAISLTTLSVSGVVENRRCCRKMGIRIKEFGN